MARSAAPAAAAAALLLATLAGLGDAAAGGSLVRRASSAKTRAAEKVPTNTAPPSELIDESGEVVHVSPHKMPDEAVLPGVDVHDSHGGDIGESLLSLAGHEDAYDDDDDREEHGKVLRELATGYLGRIREGEEEAEAAGTNSREAGSGLRKIAGMLMKAKQESLLSLSGREGAYDDDYDGDTPVVDNILKALQPHIDVDLQEARKAVADASKVEGLLANFKAKFMELKNSDDEPVAAALTSADADDY